MCSAIRAPVPPYTPTHTSGSLQSVAASEPNSTSPACIAILPSRPCIGWYKTCSCCGSKGGIGKLLAALVPAITKPLALLKLAIPASSAASWTGIMALNPPALFWGPCAAVAAVVVRIRPSRKSKGASHGGGLRHLLKHVLQILQALQKGKIFMQRAFKLDPFLT